MRRALPSAPLVIGLFALLGCSRGTQRHAAVQLSNTDSETSAAADAEVDAAAVALGAPVPAGSLHDVGFRFRVSVFHPHPAQPELLRELRKKLQAAGFRFREGANLDKAHPVVDLRTPTLDQLPPPPAEVMAYAAEGLSEEDKRLVSRSQAVTVLQFSGPAERALGDYVEALALSLALARKTHGYLWDEETRQLFTPARFASRVQAWTDRFPDVSQHVQLHAYRDGELLRIVSLGMVKFGLPDVVVNQVASTSSDSMSTLVNVVCQLVLERGALQQAGHLHIDLDAIQQPTFKRKATSNLKPNAAHVLDVELALATRANGDADNRLMEIAFPGPVDSLLERQDAALSQLFGFSGHAIAAVHDAELIAASERARKRLLTMRTRYSGKVPFGETLLVKAPFATPEGNREWMWVEVVRWQGDTIHGILNSDPSQIPGLAAGARVSVSSQEVFDYLLERGDAGQEGNETGAILLRREGKAPP